MVAMRCSRCGREISEDEVFGYFGEALCDDCYMDARFQVKPCDPWATYAATRSRQSLGLKGTEGLTELQKEIYDFIKRRGKPTREEVMENFRLSQREIETQLAVLRHCELVKGHKEGNRVYLVPFNR